MQERKWRVGYPDGSGYAGGRQEETEITAFNKDAGVYTKVFGIPRSEEYDCDEIARLIVEHHNACTAL